MIKKIGLTLTLLIAAIVISWYFVGGSVEENQQQNDTAQVPPLNDKTQHPKNAEERIDEIFTLALRGRVPRVSIVAGETKIKEVYKKWGEPDKTTQEARGQYDSYAEKHVTIGYHDDLIFEVRTSYPELQLIHVDKIKEMHGEPDVVRYRSETYDQKILVYKISENYQLEWILTTESEGSVVDHISVVTMSDTLIPD